VAVTDASTTADAHTGADAGTVTGATTATATAREPAVARSGDTAGGRITGPAGDTTAGPAGPTGTTAVARTTTPAPAPVPPAGPPTAPLRTTTEPAALEVTATPVRARRERAPAAGSRHTAGPTAAVFRRRPRVRRVTRVVRSVDAWTVFKVSAVFWLATYVIALVAGVLLWNVAHTTGTVENVERFFTQFGWASFEFQGGEIYHAAWTAGLFIVVGLVGFSVFLATVFNLITQLVGGIRVSVLEEEVLVRARPAVNAVDEPAATAGIVVDRPGL
jgi:hypothetical protein